MPKPWALPQRRGADGVTMGGELTVAGCQVPTQPLTPWVPPGSTSPYLSYSCPDSQGISCHTQHPEPPRTVCSQSDGTRHQRGASSIGAICFRGTRV